MANRDIYTDFTFNNATIRGLPAPVNPTDVANKAYVDSLAGGGSIGTTRQTIYIPASAMSPRLSSGPNVGYIETTTNKINIPSLDFDPSVQEHAQFNVAMPRSWDEGQLSYEVLWYHPTTTTNFGVTWVMEAMALSDTNTLETSFGPQAIVSDTGGSANTLYDTPESALFTVGNIPAENDTVVFQIYRLPSDVNDTLAVDARLVGIRLYYTNSANTDAPAIKDNVSATSQPLLTNDSTQGYSVGSKWLWAGVGLEWVCIDATTNNAVWHPINTIPLLPRLATHSYFRTDFYEPADDQGTDYPSAFWRRFNSGTAAAMTRPQGVPHVGRLFRKGTTATGFIGYGNTGARVGSVPVNASVTLTTNTVIQIRPTIIAGFTDAPDATNNYGIYFGFHAGGTNAIPTSSSTDYALFAYRWTGTAVEFVATSRGGFGITTTVLTTPASATDTSLQIIINGVTSVVFLVNGVVVATHTTTVPRSTPAGSANYTNTIGIWGVAGTVDRGFWCKMLDCLIKVT